MFLDKIKDEERERSQKKEEIFKNYTHELFILTHAIFDLTHAIFHLTHVIFHLTHVNFNLTHAILILTHAPTQPTQFSRLKINIYKIFHRTLSGACSQNQFIKEISPMFGACLGSSYYLCLSTSFYFIYFNIWKIKSPDFMQINYGNSMPYNQSVPLPEQEVSSLLRSLCPSLCPNE